MKTKREVIDILTNGTIVSAELFDGGDGGDENHMILHLDTGVRIYADAPSIYLAGATIWDERDDVV